MVKLRQLVDKARRDPTDVALAELLEIARHAGFSPVATCEFGGFSVWASAMPAVNDIWFLALDDIRARPVDVALVLARLDANAIEPDEGLWAERESIGVLPSRPARDDYPVVLTDRPWLDGQWVALVPDLAGLWAAAPTRAEAASEATRLAGLWIQAAYRLPPLVPRPSAKRLALELAQATLPSLAWSLWEAAPVAPPPTRAGEPPLSSSVPHDRRADAAPTLDDRIATIASTTPPPRAVQRDHVRHVGRRLVDAWHALVRGRR